MGHEVVFPLEEFEHLVELARQGERIDVEMQTDEVPAVGIMCLAEQGGAFDWLREEPELYTVDLKVRYR